MLYLIRHGETEYNVQGRLQGSLDSPLTSQGIRQARAIGRSLRKLIEGPKAWTIESSPLMRALTTARIIGDELGLTSPIVVEDRLREVSLGSWEGLTVEEIDERWPEAEIKKSIRRAWARHCLNGEAYETSSARLAGWLSEKAAGDRIVVTHGIAGSILRGLFAGLPRDQLLGLPVQQNMFFELHKRNIRAHRISDAQTGQ